MQEKEILTVALGSAIMNQDEETLGAIVEKLAELPKTSIKAIWNRLSGILPEDAVAWLREILQDAID